MNIRQFKISLALAAVLAGGATQVFGQTFAATGTTTLSVVVAAESAIGITTTTTSLAEATGAGVFGSAYTGTTNFLYKVRSSTTGGGSITVKITADFAAGGPSVASPPTGDAMTYGCTSAASATPCTGPITASASSATNVATFATNAHSAAGAGSSDAGTVVWTLPNDPVYKTGTYTATATFTISAT